jgi:geranylgeranyl diphosphate synthase type I
VAAPNQTSEEATFGAEPPATPTALVPRFNAELQSFLDDHSEMLTGIHPDLGLLADAGRAAVMGGGKRLRPTFVYWGWRCRQPAGAEGEQAVIRAAASLELLHACALVHDDVMDSSDTRRGQPAAHVRFAAEHSRQNWPGTNATFGTAGAILLGDLLLSWAEEMFTGVIWQLPADRAMPAVREFDLMRTEVVGGQFLDVLAQTRGAFDPAEALRVIEFKTSKYTVQRPLLLGASAAGAEERTRRALAEFGLALGEAFQLRDDLLGVFGDPSETGKPAGDDLREGKRTLLVALAAQSADRNQLTQLQEGVGDPDLDAAGVTALRQLLSATGARHAVEARIVEQAAAAEAALQQVSGTISDEAFTALIDLTHAASHRSF